jgi:hypothetical protein
MLDGLGMAETTPGPLIMVLQFAGFMAASATLARCRRCSPAGLGGLLTGLAIVRALERRWRGIHSGQERQGRWSAPQILGEQNDFITIVRSQSYDAKKKAPKGQSWGVLSGGNPAGQL